MRIVAGEFRGRRLLPPVDDATRPVTDRVKQSLFDVVTPWLDGGVVWDVFAGTGSFGLEALSRGMERAVFFERHRPARLRLGRNILSLEVEDRSMFRTHDLYRANFGDLPSPSVVFLDPPYRHVREKTAALDALVGRLVEAMKPDGLLVFRHDAADDDIAISSARETDRRRWGQMTARLLAPTSARPG
ncbi:MAG: RsmD family RNA methyltransferase [Planctomycetota bacterium]